MGSLIGPKNSLCGKTAKNSTISHGEKQPVAQERTGLSAHMASVGSRRPQKRGHPLRASPVLRSMEQLFALSIMSRLLYRDPLYYLLTRGTFCLRFRASMRFRFFEGRLFVESAILQFPEDPITPDLSFQDLPSTFISNYCFSFHRRSLRRRTVPARRRHRRQSPTCCALSAAWPR